MNIVKQDRLEQQQAFSATAGWGSADLHPLVADASARTYTRLEQNGKTCLLMDAPAPEEDIRAYLKVTHHLASLGLRVPEILSEDSDAGLALIEDFGRYTFTKCLADGADELSLYLMAVDVLKALHGNKGAVEIDLPPYNMDALMREVMLFAEWFVPEAVGRDLKEAELTRYREVWQSVLKDIADARSTLVLRDYHVDNLMVVEGDSSTERCALLDYQDALIGSPAYDLMSLLEDARRDIDPAIRRQAIAHYFESNTDIDRLEFLQDFNILGAQRHAKILGIFVRLSRRDGKHSYLRHLPRVQRLFARSLAAPSLNTLKELVFDMVPDLGSIEILPNSAGPGDLSPGGALR